jgi:hypothetical protein
MPWRVNSGCGLVIRVCRRVHFVRPGGGLELQVVLKRTFPFHDSHKMTISDRSTTNRGATVMRACSCILIVMLNVWSLFGQTFNKRYDLREIGKPQSAWGVEALPPPYSGEYLIIQGSTETDTIEPGLYFTHYAIGLTKIDGNTGEKLWDKRFYPDWHGILPGWANCCDSLPGGGVVVGGSKQDTLQNLGVFLVAFDAEGDTIFTSDLGVPGQQWNGFQVKRTQDGGFVIVGQTDATGYLDGFAIKTDALGNELWRKTYGVPSPQTDALVFVAESANGDLIFGGSKYPTNFTRTHWVIRADSEGNIITDALWPETQLAGGPHVEIVSSGEILIASNVPYAANYQQDRFYLAKVDPLDLSIIWQRQYAAAAPFQVLYAAKEVPGGDIIACGVSEQIGDYQGVLLRTTSEGDSLWMFKYFYQDDVISQGVGQFYDVLPTPDGGFIATGPVYSQFQAPNPPGYSQDAWVVKVDAFGCIVPGCNPVGITEQATNLLDALRIWPNPMQSGGQVHVELDLPPSVQARDLQLTVVAMDGKVVHRQGISNPSTTSTSSTLNLTNLSPGLYHLHITNGSTWLTGGKLVVE